MPTVYILQNSTLPSNETQRVVVQDGNILSPEWAAAGWTVQSSTSDPGSMPTPYPFVRTVNGATPDAVGDIAVSATNLGGITPAQVDGKIAAQAAVDTVTYARVATLEAHGGGTGVTDTDNTAALAAAWAVSDNILLGEGTYQLAGLVTRPRDNCKIIGRGSANVGSTATTTIKLTTAAAGIRMPGSGGGMYDLSVNGNQIAMLGLVPGAVGTSAGGAAQRYENVTVNNCAGTNWLIAGLQNSHFDSCQSSGAGGDNLIIDYGAGGLKFTRFESSSGAFSDLLIRQSGASPNVYTTPTHNNFDHCIFETITGGVTYSTVHLSAGSVTTFNHCGFVGGGSQTAPVVQIDGTVWTVELNSSFFFAAAGQPMIGGAGASGAGYHVLIDGQTYVPGVGISVVDVNGNYTVSSLGTFAPPLTIPFKSASTPAASVRELGYRKRALFPFVQRTLQADGPVTLDVSATDYHYILLNSHDMTGLTLANAVGNQRLTLVIQQGVTPTTATLPTSGFIWANGITPTVPQVAYGLLVVELMPVYNDPASWVEIGRSPDASTTNQRALTDVTDWAAITPYSKGAFALSPAGAYVAGQKTIVQALVAFTSGAVFSAANWRRITEQLSPADLRPGGSADQWAPARVKGASRWNIASSCAYFMGTAGIVNTRQQFQPWDVSESITVDQWGVGQNIIGGGGTQNVKVALYAADPTTGLPTGSPILGLDTAAPAIDLTTGTAGTRGSAALSNTVTIPPGRYWISLITALVTPTTVATLAYIAGHDARITYTGAYTSYQYSSALFNLATSAFGAVPALNAGSSFAYAVFFRQTA